MIDFEKLYEPYAEKASLEETLTWLSNQAQALKLPDELVQQVITETFLEMASGKTFATDGGDTGFTGFPHAELNHYMLRKLRDKAFTVSEVKRKTLEDSLKLAIEKYIQSTTTKIKPEDVAVEDIVVKKETGFFNLKASPILKVFGYGS